MNKTIKSIGRDKCSLSYGAKYMEIAQGIGLLETPVNTQASGSRHSSHCRGDT